MFILSKNTASQQVATHYKIKLMGIKNPYQASAGEAMDRYIHEKLFGESVDGECPAYSTDDRQAQRVKRKLRIKYSTSITTGKTRIRLKPCFARYGSDPSTSTEVLAETMPLAICRMALLLIQRDDD